MNEGVIARCLSRSFMKWGAVCILDRTKWTGYEADLLIVDKTLRIVDVEIKISRADFKRDAEKDKWWRRPDRWSYGYSLAGPPAPDILRPWPPKVWKHYFAMPAAIWKPELVEFLPSPKSGIILLDGDGNSGVTFHRVERRASPNKDADKVDAASVIDIARLQNIRMWEAYNERDQFEKAIHETKTRGDSDVGDSADDRSH